MVIIIRNVHIVKNGLKHFNLKVPLNVPNVIKVFVQDVMILNAVVKKIKESFNLLKADFRLNHEFIFK